jgi:hypothetical protein
MSVTLVPEDDLHAALRPYRVDPDTFESAVRAQLTAYSKRKNDPFANLSPALRGAAAFLPLEVIAPSQMTGAAVRLAPATGLYKLLGYVAFPAISLFVLLGAAVLSIAKIRRIRNENASGPTDKRVLRASTIQWWHDHRSGALLVFAATVAMSWVGATWLLFLFYILSLGLLIYVLTSFARIGLGNRLVVGPSCLMGMALLGQIAGFPGIGDQDIHVVDQSLIVPVFFCGALVVFLVTASSTIGSSSRADGPRKIALRLVSAGLFIVAVVSLTAWYMRPILWPATPARIKAYVESFDRTPFSTASWQQWEIVASWTVESKLNPDLSGPRRLLATELAGEQNPFILGSAFRVGLVQPDQLSQLTNYDKERDLLLDDPMHLKETQTITSLEQTDWLIRASVLRNDLTVEQRDYLAKRLHLTLKALFTAPLTSLETPLRATQLLEVIGRPVDPDQYRDRMHELLRKCHSKKGGGFQVAGGFKDYNANKLQVGSLTGTAYAVELMEIYGIPDEFDLNWVRSFLRPLAIRRSPEKWMAAVTVDRLNRLPGVTQPTWPEILYYERSLLAATVLVGLCIYATLSSPMPRAGATTDGTSQAKSLHGEDPV